MKPISMNFFFFVSFYLLYQPNLELIGFIICIVLFGFVHANLCIDIITSKKKEDPVVALLVTVIRISYLTSFLFLMTLYNLHIAYNKFGMPIQLTSENRIKFNTFKELFISLILIIAAMAILFFTMFKYDNVGENGIKGPFDINDQRLLYEPFFNFNSTGIFSRLFLLFKIILSITMTFISVYLVYLAYILSRIPTNRLYIPETSDDDTKIPDSFPKNKFTDGLFSIGDIFQNLNLNFLSNYTPVV